jgi:hypothetical protein
MWMESRRDQLDENHSGGICIFYSVLEISAKEHFAAFLACAFNLHGLAW